MSENFVIVMEKDGDGDVNNDGSVHEMDSASPPSQVSEFEKDATSSISLISTPAVGSSHSNDVPEHNEELIVTQDEDNDRTVQEFPRLGLDVLEVLMGFLPVSDLLSCRKVNSDWKLAAKSQFKKKACIRPEIFSNLCSLITSPRGDHYLQLLEIGNLGTEKLSLNLSTFHGNAAAQIVLLNFFDEFGAQFRKLKLMVTIASFDVFMLVNDWFTNLHSLNIVILEFGSRIPPFVYPWMVMTTNVLPSVKMVTVDVYGEFRVPIHEMDLESDYIVMFRLLMEMTPSVESFRVMNSPRISRILFADMNLNMILDIFQNLRATAGQEELFNFWPNLVDLGIDGYDQKLSIYDMDSILSCDVRFRKLELPGYDLMADSIPALEMGHDLVELLQRHKDTLEVVEFKVPVVDGIRSVRVLEDVQFISFPMLPILKKLKVDIVFEASGSYQPLEFLPIIYAEQLPFLEELDIYVSCSEFGFRKGRFDRRVQFLKQFFPDEHQICATLRRLKVSLPYAYRGAMDKAPDFQEKFLGILDRMFPNVTNHAGINSFRSRNM